MSLITEKLPLRAPSPAAWLAAVLGDFDQFMIDHAACERKASALAMSFVVKFADRTALMEPMICLAKEELAHFHEVYRLLMKRGLNPMSDEKDPYVASLLKAVRHGREEHFLDRLLVSGIVEARGCERFEMVGQALTDQPLKDFYLRLAREEAGHYMIFLRGARHYFPEELVKARLNELLDLEAAAMLAVPPRPAVH